MALRRAAARGKTETVSTDSERDVLLLRAWAAGDEAAGVALVEQHIGVVRRFFSSKLQQSVEDLVHATFEACLRQAQSYRGDGSVRGYLLGIARRQLFNHFRGLHREARALELEHACVETLVAEGNPSSALRAREERTLLLLALRRIPLQAQMLVELYYWEGLSTQEIGQALDIPAGTVKSRLYTARGLLRAQIEAAAVDEGLRRSTLNSLDTWAQEVRTLRERLS